MPDPLLLSCAGIHTFFGTQPLTNASGFFFERAGRLYLVTSRHVFSDPATGHRPDRIEIELHADAGDLGQSTGFSMPLYRDGLAVWRAAVDAGGAVDVAVIEVERAALPAGTLLHAFTPAHVATAAQPIALGAPLLIVGFPLGIHDRLHHMPVARHAIVSSTFGLRFDGQGYFLTDARTHRGTSGAPVVVRMEGADAAAAALPWRLLGVHSSTLDVGPRDRLVDEALGLNCAWYADVLLTLTAD